MFSVRIMFILCALAATVVPTSVAAQSFNAGVRVLVDGQPISFDQPPLVMGARVLVPLRGVFERLGASVDWFPAEQMVIARRADREVQLRIGSTRALVNGQSLMLDAPAMVVRGRTLVPLRFVSEAMGAQVQWVQATRTVFITSGAGAQPFPPVPQAPPVVQPPASPPIAGTIEGVVVRVDAFTSPQRLLVRRDNSVYTITITPNTLIRRTDVATNQSFPITLDQIRSGDFIRVTSDAAGRALVVTVTSSQFPQTSGQTVRGRLEAISGAFITVDGRTYRLEDNARFTVNGQAMARDQLRPGMEVVLVLNPQTAGVMEVALISAGVSPTGILAPPVITSPTNGQLVGAPIIVRGTATPGHRVHVRIEYRSSFIVVPIQGTLGEATTTADPFGNWEASITPTAIPLVNLSRAQLTIIATAIDPSGRRSEPSQVTAQLQ